MASTFVFNDNTIACDFPTIKDVCSSYALANLLARNEVNVLWLAEETNLKDGKILKRGTFVVPAQIGIQQNNDFIASLLKSYSLEHEISVKELKMPIEISARALRPLKSGIYCGETHRASFIKYWVSIAELLGMAGFNTVCISDHDLRKGNIEDIDVLIMPGGSSTGKALAIQPSGAETIRKFLEMGGKYIGICAGMYLILGYNKQTAPFKFLNNTELLNHNKTANTSIPFYTMSGEVILKMRDGNHPVFFNMPSQLIPMIFERGPLYKESNELETLAIFEDFGRADWAMNPEQAKDLMKNKPAILEFKQKYVLFASHPEDPSFPHNAKMLFNALLHLTADPEHVHVLSEAMWISHSIQRPIVKNHAQRDVYIKIIKRFLDKAVSLESELRELRGICMEIQSNETLWYLTDVWEGCKDVVFNLKEIKKIIDISSVDLSEMNIEELNQLEKTLQETAQLISHWGSELKVLKKLSDGCEMADSYKDRKAKFELICHQIATGVFSLKLNKRFTEFFHMLKKRQDDSYLQKYLC